MSHANLLEVTSPIGQGDGGVSPPSPDATGLGGFVDTANEEKSKSNRGKKNNQRTAPRTAEQAERYERLGELGRGGWGFVVQARDRQLEREIAIKQIHAEVATNEALHQRFLHEAKITSQLQHPGIVPVHELGVAADGAPYYVMKLLEGETLRELIDHVHSAPQKSLAGGYSLELLQRFTQVANAVAYAHERGVIHRDLKPSNVMVGRFGETIVVDWGLAKKVGSDEKRDRSIYSDEGGDEHAVNKMDLSPFSTGMGSVIGTPSYMSPEQAAGDPHTITQASDIYALGVMLYEVLTGHNPFRSEDVGATLSRVKTGEYRPPRALNRSIPGALAAICTHAMARDPAQRYASAQELIADLARFLAGEAVSVYAEPWWERAARWCKRHRTLVTSVLGALVVLTISSVIFGLVIQRAYDAERAAHAQSLERLGQARQAGDAWLVDLSGSLQFFPGLGGVRAELLEQGVQHYQSLLADYRTIDLQTADLPTRLEVAKCYLRLGDLARLQQEFDIANEQYELGARWLNAAETKNSPEARLERIHARIGLELLRSESSDKSAPKALIADDHKFLTQLLGDIRTAPVNDLTLQAANTLARWQLAATRSGTSEQPTAVLAQAAAWAAWLTQHRGAPRDHQLYETVQSDRAAALQADRRLAEASDVWQSVIAALAVRIQDSPARPDLLQSRAYARMQAGELELEQQKFEVAAELYRDALADLQQAWLLCDADSFYRQNSALAEANLGRALAAINQRTQATEHLVGAVDKLQQAIRVEGALPSVVASLAECYQTLGELANDAAEAERHFDSAEKCYQLLSDHGHISPVQQRRWSEIRR